MYKNYENKNVYTKIKLTSNIYNLQYLSTCIVFTYIYIIKIFIYIFIYTHIYIDR